ncbi:MAG: hypothetical protein ACRD19_07685 [Terriglobia bacterium]
MIDKIDLTESSCREALAAILASETLRHSDQLRKILQFVCQEAIEGRGPQVTESVIAIDVLNRLPSYNPADDSSVRSRIYTLRKKLAHYYEVENPTAPICIDIPKGSYIPHFFLRVKPAPRRKTFLERPLLWVASVLVISALILAAAFAFHLRRSDAQRVWAPVIESGKGPVLVIVGSGKFVPSGGPADDSDAKNQPAPDNYRVNRLGTGDARALFRLGNLFGRLHVPSELRLSSTASFEDLHRSPTVLLSAFNNQFTLEAIGNLRYHFVAYDTFSGQIEDSKNPSSHWRLSRDQDGNVIADYGIAARLLRQQSQEPTMVAAGLEQCGTEASLELLTSALPQLIQRMPAGWEHKNFEVLVGVKVVDGSCGLPSILRIEVW